jgi:ABC-type polysaccharide/polyol phosphate export permease
MLFFSLFIGIESFKSFYWLIHFFIIQFLIILCNIFSNILGQIAHNVPAVYDVLTARIRALRSKDQGWQNVGGVSRGNGA